MEERSLEKKSMSSEIIRSYSIKEDKEQMIEDTNELAQSTPLHSSEYFMNENKIIRTQNSYLQNQLNLLNNKTLEISQKNQQILQDNSLLNNSLNQLKEQVKLYEGTISTLNMKIENQSKEVINLQQTLSSNQAELKAKDILLKDNEKQIVLLNNQIIEKNNKITEQINTISTLSINRQEFEAKIYQLTNEIMNSKLLISNQQKSYEQTINDLNQKYKMNEIIREKIQQENISLSNQLTSFQKELTNEKQVSQSTIEMLQKEKEQLVSTMKEKEALIENNKFSISSLQIKIEDYSNSINSFKKTISQLKSENIFLKQILNDKENEIKNLYEYKKQYDTHDFFDNNITNILSYGDITVLKEELKKINKQFISTKRDNEILKQNNIVLLAKVNDLVEMKEKYSNLSNENNQLVNSKKEYEKLKLKYDDLTSENNQFKKTIDILVAQNKKLLLDQTLNKNKGTLMTVNLSKEQYESFIYNNIEDLDLKLKENIKKNLSLEEKEKKLRTELNQIKKENEEIKGVMMQMEEYTHDIELTNNKLKEENLLLKENSFTSENNSPNETLKTKYSELNSKYNKSLENEKVNNNKIKELLNQINIYKENNSSLSKECLFLKEEISRLKQDITNKKVEISTKELELNKIRLNLNEAESNYKVSQNQLLEIQKLNQILTNDKELLNKTIEDLKKNTNEKIEQTNKYLGDSIQSLKNENITMKSSLNSIEGIVKSFDISKNSASTNSMIDNPEGKIQNILEQKQKELNDLKKIIEQQKISLENLTTENSMLKYQMTIFNTQKEDNSITKMNKEESNISSIENEYLKAIKEYKAVVEENRKQKEGIEYLKKTNMELINKDISSPYKFLLYQIEELSKDSAMNKKENELLRQEKENMIKHYSEINLNNEKMTIEVKNLKKVNEEYIKENSNLLTQVKSLSLDLEQIKKRNSILEKTNVDKIKELEECKQSNATLTKSNNELNDKLNMKIEQEKKIAEKEKLMNEHNSIKLKEELESKVREIKEAKSKTFNHFYLTFKNSKKIISYLSNINSNLQEQLSKIEEIKLKYEDKISKLELEKVAIENNLKEKEKTILSLQNDLTVEKEKSSNFERNLKIVSNEKKDPSASTNTNTVQQYYNKMFLLFRKTPSIISFLNSKVDTLEKENESLKKEIENLQNINKNSNYIEKEKMIDNLKCENEKNNMKSDFISKEILSIGNYIKGQIDTNGNNQNSFSAKKDYEKNKTFSSLITQMRKALKIINYLMTHVSESNQK